jgi:predicted nuclease of predicted toxin-antitoxin system
LGAAGHDAVHVGDLGLLGRPDTDVMRAAHDAERVVVSADTDFGELLALGRHPGPSVVIFRRCPHRPEGQCRLLLASLADVEGSLARGAVVLLTPDRARIRLLPITPSPGRPPEGFPRPGTNPSPP